MHVGWQWSDVAPAVAIGQKFVVVCDELTGKTRGARRHLQVMKNLVTAR
jgi:hypothetical protein